MLDFILLLLLIPISIASNSNGITNLNFVNNRRLVPLSCPCEDKSLCDPIPRAEGKTRVAYSRVAANWKYFDLTKITELIIFFDISEMDPQVICAAHKNNVQLHLLGLFNHETFLNSTQKEMWIKESLDLVKENFLDGINIDYEEGRNSEWEPHLVKFVVEISSKLKSMNPNYQLTYCLPVSPLANHDLATIPKVVDYLMLMDYDQSWNNPQHCYASANQQPQVSINGLVAFLELGIPPSKIVIGLPWYGYLYPCVNVTDGRCYFDNCNKYEGRQVVPTAIYNQYIINGTYPIEHGWDYSTISPYITITSNDNALGSTEQQYWYDNGYSLTQKASIYKYYDIRGIAAFHVDCVNYTIPGMQEMVKELWDSFDVFED